MICDTRTLIVGAGQSGRRTAELLGRLDCERNILLIGNEDELPNDRPPLSKELLLGEERPRGLMQRTHDAFVKQRIDLRLGTRIARLNVQAAHVETQAGDLIPYDSLVIATGARARARCLSLARIIHACSHSAALPMPEL
ncbi:FAD-dependent oxidoreductase [Bradyrhizobium sp. WSM 1738]|uniref:FAD-dependent oxidoreductase n=1 Tax=Bradyrhizobium hereditatis TaxID=2821405 RepID=UPI0035D5E4AC|nr:FAD-dependent oxidoreductase [Bradyrhizobium hereditatis]